MKAPSKQILRMAMIRDIQLHMMAGLFNDRMKTLMTQKEFKQIADANCLKIGATTATFMFGSTWYPVSKQPYNPTSNRILHEDFRVRVDELVNGIDNKTRAFKAAVSTLISNVLSVARHIDDLYNIFPKELQAVLPVVGTTLFNIGSPLSKEEIAEINTINTPNLTILHKLLMNRILCAQVKP